MLAIALALEKLQLASTLLMQVQLVNPYVSMQSENYSADLAIDGSQTTSALTHSLNDTATFTADFQGIYPVHTIRVSAIFFSDVTKNNSIISGGDGRCFKDKEVFKTCSLSLNDVPVYLVAENETEIFCGVITNSLSLSQSDQIYDISCDSKVRSVPLPCPCYSLIIFMIYPVIQR